jgi:hypothetical protein
MWRFHASLTEGDPAKIVLPTPKSYIFYPQPKNPVLYALHFRDIKAETRLSYAICFS